MNSTSFYSNDHISWLIKKELNDECDSIKSDIDCKAQTDSLDSKLEENRREEIIQKSIQFVEIVEECCNKNIEKINNYFKENPDIKFPESQDIESIKENIKMSVLEYSCLFISNNDLHYLNQRFPIGILFQIDEHLSNDQKDYIM
jgi:hypothetical protein